MVAKGVMVVVVPVGTGKTHALIKACRAHPGRVIWIACQEEIVKTAAAKVRKERG